MALQLVDAMSPFAGAGIVNMPALAGHVLQFGFGVKNPDQFIQAPPPPPPEMGGPPPGPDQGAPMPPDPNMLPPGGQPMPPQGMPMLPQGGGMPPSDLNAMGPMPQGPEALSGVDPAVLAALSQRMGMQLPNT
jgi:hypothetical protein